MVWEAEVRALRITVEPGVNWRARARMTAGATLLARHGVPAVGAATDGVPGTSDPCPVWRWPPHADRRVAAIRLPSGGGRYFIYRPPLDT